MKWKIGLITLGVFLGMSPLLGVSQPYSNNTIPNITVAHADSLPQQGTINNDVTWTLKNGVLTLSGGALPYSISSPTTPVANGQLLNDLVTSVASQSDSSYDSLYASFVAAITKVQLTGKLSLAENQDSHYDSSAAYFFAHLENVTSFSGLDYLDVSNVDDSMDQTSAGLLDMFAYDSSLKTFTAPRLSDAHPHSLQELFANDTALVNLDLSHLDNNNATNYRQLIQNDNALQTLNIGNWSKPASSAALFLQAPNLRNITFSKNLVIQQGFILQSSGLVINATPTTDFTGSWQSVGTGAVDFINNDPLQAYQDYDPQGPTYTLDELYARYSGANTANLPDNETYVWEPQDSYRFTTPKPSTPSAPSATETTEPDTATFQQFNVSAIKKIGLYSSRNFSTANRLAWFVQKPQMKQPTFTVLETTTSKAGNARYQVRDTNRYSSTYGKTGYITAQSAYVTHAYYENSPKTVTVINPGGINGYDSATLKQPKTSYRQGTQLTVKKVVTQRATTRFLLTNGHYISANKHFVIAGKYEVPTKVRAKTAVNRYAAVNLTQRNRHYPKKAHQVFKILGWDYSRGTSTSASGTLRYRVAGGYITANHNYVKAIN